MNLDHAFEEALNNELSSKHAAKSLSKEFAFELDQYQTKQVIDTSGLLDYSNRTQHVETELEHVVRAYKRPSLLIKNGIIAPCASDTWKNIIDQYRTVISNAAQSVGRIELKNHGQFAWVGTGFLIDGNRIVTNRHVAKDFIERDGEGYSWKKNPNTGKFIRGRIDFLEEYQNPNEEEYNITDIEYLAPDDKPDVAILKIEESAGVSPLSLSPSAAEETMIITVGYSWKDSRVSGRWEEIHLRIFNDIYDVKRAAPGKIIDANPIELSHDCSTLGGNSGSACIDIETGKVLGLHYDGQYVKNVAVSAVYLIELV